MTLPGIRGLHFEWIRGSKGVEIPEVGGCLRMGLPGYLLPGAGGRSERGVRPRWVLTSQKASPGEVGSGAGESTGWRTEVRQTARTAAGFQAVWQLGCAPECGSPAARRRLRHLDAQRSKTWKDFGAHAPALVRLSNLLWFEQCTEALERAACH